MKSRIEKPQKGATLLPGRNVRVIVGFDPSIDSVHNATLKVPNDASAIESVDLLGMSTSSNLVVSSGSEWYHTTSYDVRYRPIVINNGDIHPRRADNTDFGDVAIKDDGLPSVVNKTFSLANAGSDRK